METGCKATEPGVLFLPQDQWKESKQIISKKDENRNLTWLIGWYNFLTWACVFEQVTGVRLIPLTKGQVIVLWDDGCVNSK